MNSLSPNSIIAEKRPSKWRYVSAWLVGILITKIIMIPAYVFALAIRNLELSIDVKFSLLLILLYALDLLGWSITYRFRIFSTLNLRQAFPWIILASLISYTTYLAGWFQISFRASPTPSTISIPIMLGSFLIFLFLFYRLNNEKFVDVSNPTSNIDPQEVYLGIDKLSPSTKDPVLKEIYDAMNTKSYPTKSSYNQTADSNTRTVSLKTSTPNPDESHILNKDFEKASVFFPHLLLQYESLKNYGSTVQERFATLVVEQKMFQDSASVLQTVEVSELQNLFGVDEMLQAHGKELIRDGRIDDAKELSDTIRVMGNTVDPKEIIKKLSSKRRIFSQEIKQLSALILQYQNRKANNRTETRKAYLAVLSDRKIVGWNPNTDLYEMFASYDDFSRKTNLLVGKFFICNDESDRLKFIDAAGSIKIPTITEAQPSAANQISGAGSKTSGKILDGSIEWLLSYSTIVKTKTGDATPCKIYLVKLRDGRFVGYNPDIFSYVNLPPFGVSLSRG